MTDASTQLDRALAAQKDRFERALDRTGPPLAVREVGVVMAVSPGVARVRGLPGIGSEELIRFDSGALGLAFNIDRDEIGVVLLDPGRGIEAGDQVTRLGRVADVPVGEALLGRIVDPVGRPLDEAGPVQTSERLAAERPAPPIMDRAPVATPLATGIKAIDALIPIGRGQRELIVGDRQTGKTAIAVDAMINQADKDVVCIYCAIGQRASAIARVVDDLRRHDALRYTIVVATTGEDPPGLQFLAPYAATSMGEHLMAQGRDVLLTLDDMTHHARAYREVSLLLRRPPGREAYPGDVFYIHSRLLERATHRRDSDGSLTVLPIVETQAQNLSAYIPTNLISITDGQICLSPDLFQKGVLPAVDIGRSVSRVGGKAQPPAYRAVAGDLKLSYAQFEELERFSRYGTRLEEGVRRQLERGRRVREVLKQAQFEPMPVAEQVAVLLGATNGVFDQLPITEIAEAEKRIRQSVLRELPELCQKIAENEKLSDEQRERLLNVIRAAVGDMSDKEA